MNKNHKTFLLFSILSRILSMLLRSGTETNHLPDGTLAEKLTTRMALPDRRLPLPVRRPVCTRSHLDRLHVSAAFRAPHSQITQLYPLPVPKMLGLFRHIHTRSIQSVSPCLRPLLRILWMGKTLLSKE